MGSRDASVSEGIEAGNHMISSSGFVAKLNEWKFMLESHIRGHVW